MNKKRHSLIAHFSEIEEPWSQRYTGREELHTNSSPFSEHFKLAGLGIHHQILKPGRRTSLPHAERDEDEFIYVIDGHPEVWIDGEMYALNPGDGVGFPKGTGESHTFINNTTTDVRILVVGEAGRPGNRVYYSTDAERNELIRPRGALWEDVPKRKLGSHDGLPDQLRKLKK